jgi:hypothetical protein
MGKLDSGYQEELRAQLQDWSEQVSLYQAKAESATAKARERFSEITVALQRMQDEARMKLAGSQAAGVLEAGEPAAEAKPPERSMDHYLP